MPANLMAINVASAHTHFGAFVEDVLEESRIVANANVSALIGQVERVYALVRQKRQAKVVLASANPPVAERLTDMLSKQLGARVLRVEQDLPIPIGRQLDPEAIVDEDRLLNAAAAFDVLRQACIVVDAAAAMTIDFIDGEGTFHGGAIAPGAQLMLESLAGDTALLPEVELKVPDGPIGHNTVEAIRSGVFFGLRGMLRELTEQYAELAGAYPIIVATGGDAELLFGGYDLVDRVVPDLTLLGLKLTLTGRQDHRDAD